MTTNDIELVAVMFEETPYEFIRSVREWVSPGATVHYPEFVRESVDDDQAVASAPSEDPGEDGDY